VTEFLLDKTQTTKGRRQLKEIREAQEKLAHDDKVLYMTYTVIIEGETDDELDEKKRKVANVFNNKLKSEVISDKDIGLENDFFSCLQNQNHVSNCKLYFNLAVKK
jgi:type IV secretory pathway VirB4 component